MLLGDHQDMNCRLNLNHCTPTQLAGYGHQELMALLPGGQPTISTDAKYVLGKLNIYSIN